VLSALRVSYELENPKEVKRAMSALPLEGIRIISFTNGIAGPYAGRLLCDFGAEVIVVETRKRLDTFRRPRLVYPKDTEPDFDKSWSWAEYNRGKMSISVDLKKEEGRELIKRLVELSDAAIDNFGARVLRGFGLDYWGLREVKSDFIMVSMQGLGQTGPEHEYVLWGMNLMPLAGLTYVWGFPDIPTPTGSGGYPTDYLAGVTAALMIMAAVEYRNRTGKGQFIDMAQVENAATIMESVYMDYTVNGRLQERRGNHSPYAAPYGAYPCMGEERWCAIEVRNDDEWRRFCGALGNPPWTEEPRFATVLGRLDNRDELDRRVEEWTANRTHLEVMEVLQKAGVPAAAVLDGQDQANCPQLAHRGTYVRIDHPKMGVASYPGVVMRLAESPGVARRPALLGEHTAYVLGELLGLSEAEIRHLEEAEVLV